MKTTIAGCCPYSLDRFVAVLLLHTAIDVSMFYCQGLADELCSYPSDVKNGRTYLHPKHTEVEVSSSFQCL